MSESSEDRRVVERVRSGDPEAAGDALVRHRARLKRMVEARLDRRVVGRVDPSDVLQDGFVDAVVKFPSYVADPKLPLFLWLRLIVGERLAKVHRKHLGARVRDARREVSLYSRPMPTASSAALAAHLYGRLTSPSNAAIRAERLLRLQEALNSLDPMDREIICLRHFEELTAAEAAQVLDIREAAAAKRYIRALRRLKEGLKSQTASPSTDHGRR
jgi:RNA polymerase sigma-70 factor (ECF subfamily)